MSPSRRKKLAEGIWKDKYGIAVVVRSRQHGYAEERFPRDTPLKTLKERRDELRVELRSQRRRGRAPTAPLREDVKTYLRAVKALATYSDRERDLGYWTTALDAIGVPFGSRLRASLQPHEIQAQRDAWLLEGKAASTVNHRLRALSNLYAVLNPKGENPVRQVDECDEPEALPRAIPLPIANAILSSLPPCQTRARLEVLATTGIEQATFKQLTEADVDLNEMLIRLPKRKKGKGASARILPLTPAAVRAFKSIIKWEAWGAYSTSSVYKSFKLACQKVTAAHNKEKPKAEHIDLSRLRPKDLRHTFGTALSLATGGNTSIIQQFLGHATPLMADRYRAAAIPKHLRDATQALTRQRRAVNAKPAQKAAKRLA
jgi:integrase